MKRTTIHVIIIGLLACVLTGASSGTKPHAKKKRPPKPTATETPQNVIRDADQAWQQRDKPWQTETAITLWERALQLAPEKTELPISLTRAAGRMYRQVKDPKEKEFWSEEGRRYGELAIQKNPKSPDAYAEYGAALGQWAQAHKGVNSLSAVRDAVKNLQKGLSIDPYHPYSHMLLSQFYLRSPGWPVSVGDKKKALKHAKLAVEHGPGYAINHIALARVYIARDMKAEARQELEKAISLTAPADAVPETQSDQADAKELLKGL